MSAIFYKQSDFKFMTIRLQSSSATSALS